MYNQCHCCLQRPSARDLRKPFTHLGITESYSAMFEECFAIDLIIDSDRQQGICLECVDQLRGACHFKLQVLQCQAILRERWGWQQHVKDELLGPGAAVGGGASDNGDSPLLAERSVESQAAEDAASAEEGAALLSPVCGSAASPVCSLPDVSASARARRQLAAACAVRLERLRESRAPRAQQHTYCCDMCTGQFHTKSTLIRHIRTHYRCADCRKSFMMSSCLSRHEPNCTENKRKKRELTETSASTRDHDEVLYSCDECGKGFRIKSYLRKHIQRRHTVKHLLNSSQSSLYQNPERHTQMSLTSPCANETSYKLNRQRHRKNHTKEKRFKCNYCDYKCLQSSYFLTHQRIHTGDKPFKCDHCDYKCGVKSNLRRHQRIHTEEKPFKCGYCDFKCNQKAYLQTHQRIHNGEKPFECSYCDFKCRHKSTLQTHQIIHTGEKPFKCGYCDYKCNQKSRLQHHQRIHTGEKSFKCGYCDYKSYLKCNWQAHQRIHTGDKPFKCIYCDYECIQNSTLQIHQRIHTGEKPFKCGYCDYKCRSKSNLRSHQRTHRSEAV